MVRIGIRHGKSSDSGLPPRTLLSASISLLALTSQDSAPCLAHSNARSLTTVTVTFLRSQKRDPGWGAVCPRSHSSEMVVVADAGLFWLPALSGSQPRKPAPVPCSQVTETNTPRLLSSLSETWSKYRFHGMCSGGHAHRVCLKSQLQRAEAGL